MAVGIRELKAHLSEYIARAAEGDELIITDRNRPVARLVPYVAADEVERGVTEGWIDEPKRTRLGSPQRARSERSTLDVLAEDRG